EDGIRDYKVTGVQTCALPIYIILLFRKFAVDFAEKYKTAPVQLDDEAKNLLINHSWPGNVRELKNIAEQISVLSQDKQIGAKERSEERRVGKECRYRWGTEN